MTYLSIIEKLQILFNTLLDFKVILVFIILLLVFTFVYIIKKLNTKKYMLCMFMSFVGMFLISIITNYEILSNTFDNFTTILFGNIYFPSIYVYIGVLIISLISFIISILNKMLKRIYKVINSTIFVINNILLVIILNIIARNKIDIFSVTSLYSDTSLVVILELSMGLFILWILSLMVVYVTDCICERLAYKGVRNKISNEETIFNPILEVNSRQVDDTIDSEAGTVLVEAITNNNEEKVISSINSIVDDVTENEEDASIEINNIMDNEANVYLVEDNEIIEEIVNSENIAINEVIQSNIVPETVIEIDNITGDNSVIEKQTTDLTSKSSLSFEDIINGAIPVTYYDNNMVEEEYELVNPQVVYESKYDNIKNENVVLNTVIDSNYSEKNNTNKEIELSVEEKTLKDKDKVKEERLAINTISLNDLIKEDNDINILKIEEPEVSTLKMSKKEESVCYTLDDYKKIVKMLNSIKRHSNSTNINVDDAVAMSLISNYSIDDCMKFKNILESNLN